jgi:hypothetical protein
VTNDTSSGLSSTISTRIGMRRHPFPGSRHEPTTGAAELPRQVDVIGKA